MNIKDKRQKIVIVILNLNLNLNLADCSFNDLEKDGKVLLVWADCLSGGELLEIRLLDKK